MLWKPCSFKCLLYGSLVLLPQILLPANALPTPDNQKLETALVESGSEGDRIKLLNNSDFVFDFFNPAPGSVSSQGNDGRIVTANSDTFPALVSSGVAMSVAQLGPCGLNTPHIHPRASELNLAVNGTLEVGMIAENGARLVMNTIHPGQATIFPRGAIHFEQNMGCDTVIFVAAFSDEDPGTTSIANQLFNLPKDILQAVMGGMDNSGVQQLTIGLPTSVAFGVSECLARCNLNATSKEIQDSGAPKTILNLMMLGLAGVVGFLLL